MKGMVIDYEQRTDALLVFDFVIFVFLHFVAFYCFGLCRTGGNGAKRANRSRVQSRILTISVGLEEKPNGADVIELEGIRENIIGRSQKQYRIPVSVPVMLFVHKGSKNRMELSFKLRYFIPFHLR